MEKAIIGKRALGEDPLRFIDARSLQSRFRSKADICRYLSQHCKELNNINGNSIVQYYLPPQRYLNKDFLKEVLMGSKHLVPLDQLRPISIPHYDELSVQRLFADVVKEPEIGKFFHTQNDKARLPPREYFFNILNTTQPDYLKSIIQHAQKLRYEKSGPEEEKETIEMTEEWYKELMAMPFFSSNPGKQLMLLKKQDKPGRAGFKRVKREVQQSLKRFRDSGGKGRLVEARPSLLQPPATSGSSSGAMKTQSGLDTLMKEAEPQ